MTELEQLKIENEKINARLSKAIEVFKEQKSKIASYETELNNYRNSVQTSEVSIQTHSDEEFIEMSNKLDDLSLQLQNKVSQIEQLKDQINREPQDDYVSLEKWKSLVNEKEDLNKQLNEYELKLQNSEAAYEELRKKYAELKELNDGDLKRYNDLENNYEIATQKLQNMISQEDFDDEVNRLNQTISECKKSYDEKVEDISKLQIEVEKVKKANNDLNKTIEENKNSINKLTQENNTLNEKLENIQNEKKEYQANYEKLKNDIVLYKTQNNSAENIISTIKKTLDNYNSNKQGSIHEAEGIIQM